MKQEIGLELATASDAFPIAIMSRDLVEVGLGWSWTPSRITRNIRCPDTLVLVARAREQLVGFAIMYFGEEEARLNLLGVSPDYQRTGVGRRLVAWLEESALVAGIPAVYLEVRATSQGAQAFYERLGYRKIGHVPGYYRGRETAVRMVHNLWRSISSNAK